MKIWLLVAIVIASTVISDFLQSTEMKRQGEVDGLSAVGLTGILGNLFRNWRLGVSIVGMAVSFYGFLALLQQSDLGFAVPATAGGSIAVETVLAPLVLKEQIQWKRWLGAGLVAVGVALIGG
jgi:multidrug transporter EmrE-like cation transporter